MRFYPTFSATRVGLLTRLWCQLFYCIKTKVTLHANNPVSCWGSVCGSNWMLTMTNVKATFSFHKLIPKMLRWLLYILIGHCTSLSPWFIILDKNNFIKVSHHYLTSGGYQFILYPMPCGLIRMYWVKCKQTQV